MKRIVNLVFAGAAVLALSGCGGGGVVYNDYYITDDIGAGVEDILWSCDSGTSGITDASGNFYTDGASDSCDFDFDTWGITGDIYLEDDIGSLNGVSYRCVGDSAHPGTVLGNTGPGGLINDITFFTSCSLFNLP